jgi:hypothetical protein
LDRIGVETAGAGGGFIRVPAAGGGRRAGAARGGALRKDPQAADSVNRSVTAPSTRISPRAGVLHGVMLSLLRSPSEG